MSCMHGLPHGIISYCSYIYMPIRLNNLINDDIHFCVGVLDEVANLRVTFASEYMGTFTWDDPYTLMGVPILGYKISTALTSLKNNYTVQTNTQVVPKREYTVADPFRNGFCVLINFTTSAINMAGEGPPSSFATHFMESKWQGAHTNTTDSLMINLIFHENCN